jgi:hypothetical protein
MFAESIVAQHDNRSLFVQKELIDIVGEGKAMMDEEDEIST